VESTGIVIASILGAVFGGFLVWWISFTHRRSVELERKKILTIPEPVAEIIALLDTPVIILDRSYNVMAASPGALALGLVLNRRLIGEELLALVADQQSSGLSITREVDLLRGPQSESTLNLSARARAYGERHTLLLVTDRTEYQKLEEVRRDFVANISHELKTPIGAVTLLADALREAAEDPDIVRKFSQSLATEAARLADMTGEIIELSRLQSEGALAENKKVKLDKILKEAIAQNKIAAASKAVAIVLGGDEDTEIYGDEPRLVMAFKNLLSNAVQYSPSASRVGVGISKRKGFIEVAITDQGMGMAPDEVERIFERFYRTDEARSRTTGGTGLGLSLVKHVVVNHGGEIKVWSQPGSGSTFTVRLPDAAAVLARTKSKKGAKK
jgi:two-component system sensor histidine kinase SenX3